MNIPKGQKRVIGKRVQLVESIDHDVEEPEEVEDSPPEYVLIEAWDKLQSLPPSIRTEAYAACLHSILTHILFSLSMLPSPYLALKRELAANSSSPGPKHPIKLSSFINHLDSVLELSNAILSAYDIKKVCIGIGVSVYNLKCAYTLHLPAAAASPANPTSAPVRLDNLKRVCMQKLVEYEGCHPVPHLPPTGSVYVMYETVHSDAAATRPSTAGSAYRVERGFALRLRGIKRRKRGGEVDVLPPSLLPLDSADQPSTWLLPVQGIKYKKYTG